MQHEVGTEGVGVDIEGALDRTRGRAAQIRRVRRRRMAAGTAVVAVLLPVAALGVIGSQDRSTEVVAADGADGQGTAVPPEATTPPEVTTDSTPDSTAPEAVADSTTTVPAAVLGDVAVSSATTIRTAADDRALLCSAAPVGTPCDRIADVPAGWEAVVQGGRVVLRHRTEVETVATTVDPATGQVLGTAAVEHTPFESLVDGPAGSEFGAEVTLPCAPNDQWLGATLTINQDPASGQVDGGLVILHAVGVDPCAGVAPQRVVVPLLAPFAP